MTKEIKPEKPVNKGSLEAIKVIKDQQIKEKKIVKK
jgi:hypothetical protein